MWSIKTFAELSNQELFNIYYLRVKTFVVEQNRVYQEVDAYDPNAIHVFNEVDGHVNAYARVFLKDNTVTFGRVVTAADKRGSGLGRTLLEKIMTAIRVYFPNRAITIESQYQVRGFYQKFGFEVIGEPFIFESTKHIRMRHAPIITIAH